MGHIDHGKSTLLDYIRKSNVVAGEAGGITQRLSAYQVTQSVGGTPRTITFLDTPGHEAFQAMRVRGASAADIAVLLVSAEDGVKPQTLEAFTSIKDAKVPYVVAISKIDKPNADIERTKANLAEHEIYLEGYGGTVSFVPISAKTGAGVSELLDTIILVADTEGLTCNDLGNGEGVVIESHLDGKRGNAATLIVKKGTLETGKFAVAGESIAPLRIVEDFQGGKIEKASCGDPVRVVGWNSLPQIGMQFAVVANKKEAEARAETARSGDKTVNVVEHTGDRTVIPLIVKSDAAGTLEAVIAEAKKCATDRVSIRIIAADAGIVTEGDIKTFAGMNNGVVVGFAVKVEPKAKDLAERNGVTLMTFDIIYKLREWLEQLVKERTPRVMTEEITGRTKILKTFSVDKDKQVIGGRVESGKLAVGDKIRVMRREAEIARGKIIEVQQQKVKAKEVLEGNECGILAESKLAIAPGDYLESVAMVEK